MSRFACIIGLGLAMAGSAAAAQVSKTYQYDAQGRLVTSTRAAPSGGLYTTVYDLDDADNRTERETTFAASRSAGPGTGTDQTQTNAGSTGLPPVRQPGPGDVLPPNGGDEPLNPED